MASPSLSSVPSWRVWVNEAVELLREDGAAVSVLAGRLAAEDSPLARAYGQLLPMLPPLFTRAPGASPPLTAVLALFEELGDASGQALVLCGKLVQLRPQMATDDGWALASRRLAPLAAQIELSPIRVFAWNAAAVSATDSGRVEEAARWYYAALDDSRQLGLSRREAHVRANIGELLYVCGNTGEAVEMLEEALLLAKQDRGPWLQTYVRAILALCRLTLGEPAAAKAALAPMLSTLQHPPIRSDGPEQYSHWSDGFACAAAALVLTQTGDLEVAEQCLTAAHSAFATKRAPQLAPYAWWASGQLRRAQGRIEEALVDLQKAIDTYDDAGYVFLPMRVSWQMYEIHRERGNFELALALYERYHGWYDTVQSQSARTRLQLLTARQALKGAQAEAARERELAAMKTKFIAMASHEFRTPLAAVQSTSELLRYYHDRMDEEEREQVLSDLMRSVDRLKTTMEQVLLLSKGDAGKLSVQRQAIDWPRIAQDVVRESSAAFAQRNPIDLHFESDVKQCVPLLDETLFRQALANLVSNACKYSDENQPVEVHFERERNEAGALALAMHVRDRGIGIPEADRRRLFESFERGSNTEHVQGTGLGLVIVHRAAQMLGAQLSYDSEVGRGSTFTLRFPLD